MGVNKTELLDLIKCKAKKSAKNHFEYAGLVNDLEFLAEQNPDIFKEDKTVANYKKLWVELEILNAVAFAEWEKGGYQKLLSESWIKIWTAKYMNEAKMLIENLINYIEPLF